MIFIRTKIQILRGIFKNKIQQFREIKNSEVTVLTEAIEADLEAREAKVDTTEMVKETLQ